jgi:hypothetical protein
MREIGQNVLQASFETESGNSPVTTVFSSLSLLDEAFIRNIIIILRINYILIIFIINNKAVIIINGRLQGLILLLKIPMSTGKDFFEIYRLFGHAPSKRFASAAYE